MTATLWTWLLIYLRVQAVILSMPVFSERYLGVRVKVALAMAMTPLFTPFIAPVTPGIPAVLSNLVIGLAIGMIVRILFSAINIAATAMAMTASLSQLFGTGAEAAPHPIGTFLHLGGVAVVMALGLPLMMADLIAESFQLWPITTAPEAGPFFAHALTILVQSFRLAMILASPFILGGFLYQSTLGIINKVMPALPVVLIGSPLALIGALVGLALLAPALVAVWADAVLSYRLPVSP